MPIARTSVLLLTVDEVASPEIMKLVEALAKAISEKI
jgi:hypothetical protein